MAKKNFISFRMQSYNNLKIKECIKHNIRKNKSLSIKNDNYNFYIDNDLKVYKYKYGDDNNFIKETNSKLFKSYNKDREEHKKLYKNHNKRNVRDGHSSWAEGLFTFSEAIHDDLGTKYTEKELMQVGVNAAQELCEHMGTELGTMYLHMDETTPHFHFFFKNFNEKGLSVVHKNKTRDNLSFMQDLTHKHFSQLGMDRGIKKTVSGLDYTSVSKYNQQQQTLANTLTRRSLDALDTHDTIALEVKNMLNKKSAVIEDYEARIKTLVNSKKKLLSENQLSKNEIRTLNKVIRELRDELKELKKDKVELNKLIRKLEYNNIELKNENNNLKNNTANSSMLLSENRKLKAEVNNIDNIVEARVNEKLAYSNAKMNELYDYVDLVKEYISSRELIEDFTRFYEEHTNNIENKNIDR